MARSGSAARARSLPWTPLVLACLVLPTQAVELVEGRIALIRGQDWRVAGLAFSLDLGNPSLPGSVRIDLLELTGAGMSFADIDVNCGNVQFTTAALACLDGEVTLDLPGAGRRSFPGEAIYDRKSGATRFDLRDLPFAQGRIELRGSASEIALDLEFTGSDLKLADLAAMAAAHDADFRGIVASGAGTLSGSLRLRDGALDSLEVTAELVDASLSNDSGTLVTDAMHALVDVTASNAGGGWQFGIGVTADAGEAYLEPVYANVAENHLSITANGHAARDFTDIDLREFTLTQGSLIDVGGNLRIRAGAETAAAMVSGEITLDQSSVEAIYAGLLQVVLAGTAAGDLDTSGTVSGTVTLADTTVSSFDLALEDVGADDRQRRFAVHGLNGSLRWPGAGGSAEAAEPSRLQWESAALYDIPLDGGTMVARIGGDDLLLDEPLRIPTMGGALVLERLRLENYGAEDASGLLDARLEPIELKQLTGAFGWPAFSGSLSGELPLLQYEHGVVTLGGALAARAFDGEIAFENLRLEEPLGLVPRLYGDLRLRGLDLEQVTDTFSFGLIQGRLSGDVTGLQVIGWRPVAMDLHLYTPAGGRAPRRISQRAVENLASVGGGGAAAALSSGFMKFFEEFSYESIGIRCVLLEGVCRMSGAGPAGASEFGQGYYIVKGRGLPRIDVVGYRHQVSWPALVRQLVNITQSGPAIVDQEITN